MSFINQFGKLFFSFFLILNVSYAESLLYKDLQKMCELNENSNQENKELSCFYYIKGYLEVANHNCAFDQYSNNLHKLDTTNIKFEQILKSLNIYDQKFSTIESGNAIDHLWSALNNHWPCNN